MTTVYWERGRPRPHCAQHVHMLLEETNASVFDRVAGEGARVPS
jgi:hypothetical protein